MHKLHKYCKKHCDKVQPSKTTESVYYYFGDTEIRVSNHLSVQNKINILIDSRSDNYILILKDYPDDKFTKKSIDKLTLILKAIYQDNYRHLLNQDNWETSYLF